MSTINGIIDENSGVQINQFGVPGMKWGVRKDRKKARKEAKVLAKTLSDDELKAFINRLQLEKQYVDLVAPSQNQTKSTKSLGKQAIQKILVESGQEVAKSYVKSKLQKALIKGS